MKKILATLAAVAALTAAAPAFGADLGGRSYYKTPPAYAAPLYNWTGFYIGGTSAAPSAAATASTARC